jgi:hypothetical protein
MALETSLANIVVRNNTIDKGTFSTGSTPVSYTYTHNAWVFGAAIIEGNTFMNSSASADMLNLDECSCIVKGNKFIRNATSVNSYIRNYGSSRHVIVDNIFDNHTVDGTTEDIVIGLTDDSQYECNVNQTAYAAIRLSNTVFLSDQNGHFSSGTNTVPTDTVLANFSGFPTGFAFPSLMESLNLSLFASNTLGKSYSLSFQVDLSAHIPQRTKLISAALGLVGDGSRAAVNTGADFKTSSLSSFDMSVQQTQSLAFDISSLSSSVTNPIARWGTDLGMDAAKQVIGTGFTISSTTDVDNFVVTSSYMTLDASAEELRLTLDKQLIIRIEYNIVMNSANGATRSVKIRNGPLLIKYRW